MLARSLFLKTPEQRGTILLRDSGISIQYDAYRHVGMFCHAAVGTLQKRLHLNFLVRS